MFKIILFLCAASSIIIVLFIFGYMLSQGGNDVCWVDNERDLESTVSQAHHFPTIANTLYCSMAGALIGLAIGLPCAIYLAEFSSRLRNFVKPALEVLMGFPFSCDGTANLSSLLHNYIHKPSFRSGNMHFGCLYGSWNNGFANNRERFRRFIKSCSSRAKRSILRVRSHKMANHNQSYNPERIIRNFRCIFT